MKEHCKQNIENIVASQLNDHSFVRQRLWLLPSILSHSSAFDRSHINLRPPNLSDSVHILLLEISIECKDQF